VLKLHNDRFTRDGSVAEVDAPIACRLEGFEPDVPVLLQEIT
jgi:hypothetical protein